MERISDESERPNCIAWWIGGKNEYVTRHLRQLVCSDQGVVGADANLKSLSFRVEIPKDWEIDGI